MTQDYLHTYNPNNFEAHPDSSDFESCVPPLPHIKNKPGYHRLIKASFHSKVRKIYNKADCGHPKNDYDGDSPLKERQTNNIKLCQKINKGYENQYNKGNPSENRPSRLCVLRQKVIPRFSSIFRQTASNNKPAVKRERKLANTSCQQCQTCLRKKIKKPYSRRENSIVQPVYTFEAEVDLPKVFIPNDGPNNTYSFTSSSDSGNPEKLRRKNSKIKKRFRTEMMREHWNYQHHLKQKYQKHPNTPTDDKQVQQIFNSSARCHQSRLVSSISDYSYMDEMPSSGFWDFLFDKIHTKYQIHKCEVKPCSCDSAILNTKLIQHCCCDPKIPCFYRTNKSNQYPSLLNMQDSPMSRSPPSSVQKTKVTCKCKPPSTKNPKSQGSTPKSPMSLYSPTRPPDCLPVCPSKCSPAPACPGKDKSNTCQEDHDQIKNMLSKKYNGEILCIHNPPCILINGCLNLPAATVEQPNSSFWPLLFKNIPVKKHARKVKKEKSCQYGQSSDVRQARVPEVKEKKMLSLCSRVPACEVTTSSDQKKYDLKLNNSCNYVPMNTKHADSIQNRSPWGSLKNYVCDHFPKCEEVPVYSKSENLLNGAKSFGAQAQQDTSHACRHTPPCIMVPKCLGGVSVMKNYMQYDAIPDCSHSPVCETIPACCRNNHKEMVSVSSQYPHSCRIV